MRVKAKIMRDAAIRTAEVLLLIVAIASFTVFGLLKWDEIRGQAELKAEFEQQVERSEAPDPPALTELPGEEPIEKPPIAERAKEPAKIGNALGRLRSDRIGLDVMIAEGVDNATLRRAAGRIPGTARLDENGNVGLAAHRDTFFRPLQKIREGDELELETLRGHYRYRVESLSVVEPENVAPLRQTPDATLTLVTCFPFHYVGPAPRRFVVHAKRVEADVKLSRLR